MMLAAREVVLRVNGMRVTDAKMRLAKNGPQLIMRAPLAFDVAVDDNSTLELLELSHPPEIRPKLPNRGWRKVSLRNLTALLRGGVFRITNEGGCLNKRGLDLALPAIG